MPRIVAMSDIHLSPTHGFFWENWCAARDFAKMLNPEAVIVNGDLCINGPDSDAEMAFAASVMRDLGDTVYALPGNHDVGDEPPGQDAEQIINGERLARWNRYFGPDRWEFDAGVWRLIGANAQLFGSGLPQEAVQYDWLNDQLSGGSGKPAALFVHKPLFIDSPYEDTASPACTPPAARKVLLELIRTSGVRLVVSGHLHQYREMAVEGVRYVWLPAVAFVAPIPLGGQRNCGLAILDFNTDAVDIRIEYPIGLVSHDLDVIKGRGRYAFLRDMPPCPPDLRGSY
jgi:3',5'-cyclic AMP phosphodiesterase CpdA